MINNTTHYSTGLYKRLTQHLFWTSQFKISITALVPILIIAVALLVLDKMAIFMVSLIIAILIISVTFFALLYEMISVEKSKDKYPEKKLKYEFNGKEFKVSVKVNGKREDQTIMYDDIKQVKTNKKYMFIYLKNKELYVVDKRGFESLDDYRGIHDLFKDRFLV